MTNGSFDSFIPCDRCGFRSYLLAYKEELELSFCLHHGRKFEAGLDGWELVWDTLSIEEMSRPSHVEALV